MFIFTDTLGRSWNLKLNVATARKLDTLDFSSTGVGEVSLLNPDRHLFKHAVSNTPFALALAWGILYNQAVAKHAIFMEWLESKGKDPVKATELIRRIGGEAYLSTLEDIPPKEWFPLDPTVYPEEAELEFAASIDGTTIQLIRESLWRSLGDFFPEQQTVLSKLTEQYKLQQERVNQKVMEMMPEVSKVMEEEVDQATTQALQEFRKELHEKRASET